MIAAPLRALRIVRVLFKHRLDALLDGTPFASLRSTSIRLMITMPPIPYRSGCRVCCVSGSSSNKWTASSARVRSRMRLQSSPTCHTYCGKTTI